MNKSNCLEKYSVCNLVEDCHDASDEKYCHCFDYKHNCYALYQYGYCKYYPSYMIHNCPYSCDFCDIITTSNTISSTTKTTTSNTISSTTKTTTSYTISSTTKTTTIYTLSITTKTTISSTTKTTISSTTKTTTSNTITSTTKKY